MKNSLPRALSLVLLLNCAFAPLVSASFLWFGPHRYLHDGHYYAHRKWVPATPNFAGFYRYWDPVAPPPPRHFGASPQ